MASLENLQNIYYTSPSSYDSISNFEKEQMNQKTKESYNATQTNIIPTKGFNQNILNINNNNDFTNVGKTYYDKEFFNVQQPKKEFVSQLTGTIIEKFEHNNMQPFFKKTPFINSDRSSVILEKYQGTGGTTYRKKQEVKNLQDVSKDVSYVYGSPVLTMNDNMKNRYVESRNKTMELPFTSQLIGPGLGEGYTNMPSGGFNQPNTRDYIMPKTVDNLRAKNNPKLSYESRIVNGLKSTSRGLVSKPSKNRVSTVYKNNPNRYLKNGGEHLLAASKRENFHFKPTNKNHRQYSGAPKREVVKHMKQPAFKKTRKNNYMNQSPRNLESIDTWKVTDETIKSGLGDFGKKSIENKPNERDITQKRAVINNITTEIKKAIVPVIDIFKKTRKENFIGNIRPDGNMKADMAPKLTVYDSDDIARTTIKETNIHDNRLGNLKGNVKNQILNTEDVARTTIKETNIHNNDPTINMSPQQPKSLRVYDPEDIPQTTMKETNIDNNHPGFIQSPNVNKTGSYNTSRYRARNTNKQFISDYEYTGISDNKVGKGGGRGYLAARYKAKDTNKQFTSIHEYKGIGKDYNNRAMSYSDKYNATLNPSKEVISRGRKPTKQSVKINVGSDRINTQNKKINANEINTREPSEHHVYQVPPTINNCGLTQVKDKLKENVQRNRMHPSDLEPFKKNPYTKSLASVF